MRIRLRKFSTSLLLSAAILAIASMDTWMHEKGQDRQVTRAKLKQEKDNLRQRLEIAQSKASKNRGLENMLRDSLSSDEFGDQLPFANLSTLDPLLRFFREA